MRMLNDFSCVILFLTKSQDLNRTVITTNRSKDKDRTLSVTKYLLNWNMPSQLVFKSFYKSGLCETVR